jgi:hypothetical protein
MNTHIKRLAAPLLAITATFSIAAMHTSTGTPLSRSEQASLHGAGTDYDCYAFGSCIACSKPTGCTYTCYFGARIHI